MLPTPDLSHFSSKDYDNVYEPAEDTFLFLDAIESELDILRKLKPRIVLEIGSGSGTVSTFVALHLGKAEAMYLCSDINSDATTATSRTAQKNNVYLECIECHLLQPFLPRLANSIDLLLFNPPYVVTPSSEVGSTDITASWAGGINGREVIDRLLPTIQNILSPRGIFYLVVIEENKPEEIRQLMKNFGFESQVVITRKAGREKLYIVKFYNACSSLNI
ncbi:N(6)-adenine-specific DNA methyltransferase 1 [Paraphysoderma sedebokerense]|nr:N(6)-adenine-specific DNA methyltransferase 1 [Paraphysoderma sedebokerense]